MVDKKEYLGKWWLPNQPNKQLFGKLQIDLKNKIELEVLGRFNDISHDVLLGITEEGENITLFDTSILKCKISKLEYTKYQCDRIIFKKHFNNTKSIMLKSFNIYFNEMENWTDLNSINRNCDFEKRILQIDTIDFQEKKLFENDLLKIKIHNKCNWLQNSFPYRNVNLQQSDFFIFELTEEINLDFVLNKILKPFNLFLTFCMFNPTSFSDITAYDIDGNEFIISFQNDIIDREMNKHKCHMLMPLSQISENFQKYYSKWVNLIEKINPIHMLYFEILDHSAKRFFHYRDFWILTVALESYHRCILECKDENNKNVELDELKEMLKSKLSAEHYKKTIPFLIKQEEVTLRKRLKQILKTTKVLIDDFLNSAKKRGVFVNKVVETRHYNTHYDIEKKYNLVNDDEFSDFLWLMMRIFEFLLLSEIGFNSNEIIKLIKKHSDYKIREERFKSKFVK